MAMWRLVSSVRLKECSVAANPSMFTCDVTTYDRRPDTGTSQDASSVPRASAVLAPSLTPPSPPGPIGSMPPEASTVCSDFLPQPVPAAASSANVTTAATRFTPQSARPLVRRSTFVALPRPHREADLLQLLDP